MSTKAPQQEHSTEAFEADVSFAHWQLPDVTQDAIESPANLFGKKANHPEVEKQEQESVLPPTMAQIEDIRAQAEAEGFEQGQQEGYQNGLEKGRLEGLEQGHLQGLEQGQQQGYEQGIAEAQTQLEQLSQLIEQFQQPLAILDSQIELELLNLVSGLSRAVIGHELKTSPEHILAALRQGVDSLPIKEQQVTIRLHPQDAQLVEELYSEEQLQRNLWKIELDPSLSQGDCIVDSQRSRVDVTLETRMRSIFEQVAQQQSQLESQIQQQEKVLEQSQPSAASKSDIQNPQVGPSETEQAIIDQRAEPSVQVSLEPTVDPEPARHQGDQDAESPTPTTD